MGAQPSGGNNPITSVDAATPHRIAVIGGGWAGMAAAVRATQLGHDVAVFEAARTVGGRARGVPLALPDGREIRIDNGQHILIGAYTDTLRLMRMVGVEPEQALLRMPMSLRLSDGTGLALPDLPAPWDALMGILRADGWRWSEKWALLKEALRWQRNRFQCDENVTVAELCSALPERLIREFMEPLCVSALNTPMDQASGSVFLRVLRDAMFSLPKGSNYLLPRCDLGTLFPETAAQWLQERGAAVTTGRRIEHLEPVVGNSESGATWRIDGDPFDTVVLAVSAPEAVRLLRSAKAHRNIAAAADFALQERIDQWTNIASALRFQAIATVYAVAEPQAKGPLIAQPLLALRTDARFPAQFVFDRDQITPTSEPTHVLAFVVSVHDRDRAALEGKVVAQAREQLGLMIRPLRTIAEKRATFACTPALQRPTAMIAPGLLACGDYIEGPYPATLEGAIRSGWGLWL